MGKCTRVIFGQSRPLVVFVARLHQLELGAQQAIREPAVRTAHVGVECCEREVRGVLEAVHAFEVGAEQVRGEHIARERVIGVVFGFPVQNGRDVAPPMAARHSLMSACTILWSRPTRVVANVCTKKVAFRDKFEAWLGASSQAT